MSEKIYLTAILIIITTGLTFSYQGFAKSDLDSLDNPAEVPSDSVNIEDNNHSRNRILTPGMTTDSTESKLSTLDTSNSIDKPWPTGALLRSALVPGWGQFYNKKYVKMIIYGGLETYFIYKARQHWRLMDIHQSNFQSSDDPYYQAQEFSLYETRRDSRNLFIWLTSLTVFVSMFDAYVDAHMAGFDQTDKSFEVHLNPETGGVEITLAYNF